MTRLCGIFLIILFSITPTFALVISEIHAKPETPQSGREWIEIFNNHTDAIDLSKFELIENSDSKPISSLGNAILDPGEYVVITQNENEFRSFYKNYTGKLFKSTFGLKDEGEDLQLKVCKKDGIIFDFKILENLLSGEKIETKKSLILIDQTKNIFSSLDSSIGTGNLSIGTSTFAEAYGFDLNSISCVTSKSSETAISYTQDYYPKTYWPESERIYVNAGENRIGIVGAEIAFEGQSVTGEKTQVTNPKYFWSFGDGESGDGKNVFHYYKFAGEYIAVLEVSANNYKNEDKVYVKVVESKFQINLKQNEREEKFVEIVNNSKEEIDIGGFLIKSLGGEFENIFTVPKRLLILPGKSINISQEVLKFATSTNKVIFAFQNGKEIVSGEIAKNLQNKSGEKSFSATSTALVSVHTKEDYEKIQKVSDTIVKKQKDIITKKLITKKQEKIIENPQDNFTSEKFVITNEDKSIVKSFMNYLGF